IAGSFKCKAGVPKAEFGNFWLNKHPKPFNSLDIVKKNIFKYKQAHSNKMVNQSMAKHDLIIVPFNVMATFKAASFKDLIAVFTSEEYHWC
ncbi:hypothetical protein SCLCIDRAFT_1147465, partial [Scleroderma citrinum Foug A]